MNAPSPSLAQHQKALKTIYEMTTAEQFDSVEAMLKWPEYDLLKPTQIETLMKCVEHQRAIHLKNPTPTPTKVEAIKEEYKAIDEEQFGATEVELPPATVNVVTTETTPTPVESVVTEEEPKTRKRKTKEEAGATVPSDGVWHPVPRNKSYTLQPCPVLLRTCDKLPVSQ